jgi:hypothetical protein
LFGIVVVGEPVARGVKDSLGILAVEDPMEIVVQGDQLEKNSLGSVVAGDLFAKSSLGTVVVNPMGFAVVVDLVSDSSLDTGIVVP